MTFKPYLTNFSLLYANTKVLIRTGGTKYRNIILTTEVRFNVLSMCDMTDHSHITDLLEVHESTI